MEILNYQPTKDLRQFQKLIVQDLYIKYLNKAIDYFEWENEKKDAIIELKDKEIQELQEKIVRLTQSRDQVDANFKKYMKEVKAAKVDNSKVEKQQAVIDQLRKELESTMVRLKTSHRLNELLVKQNKIGNR